METLSTIDWDQQESADVRAGIFRAIVDTAQLTATAYRRDPSSSWEEDRHPQDDITSVPERTIDFVFPQSIHLTAGSSTLPGWRPALGDGAAGGSGDQPEPVHPPGGASK